MIRDPNTSNGVGKTWAGTSVDRVEREDEHECRGVASSGEKDRERERGKDKDREGNGRETKNGKEKGINHICPYNSSSSSTLDQLLHSQLLLRLLRS